MATTETNLVPISRGEKGLELSTLEEMQRFANMVLKSGVVPAHYDTAAKICVALQHGYEIGFTPMAALQNIAVIRGKPTLGGEAALALAYSKGLIEDKKEVPVLKDGHVVGFDCWMKRRGGGEQRHIFTIEDAERAKLWGKSGPWKEYPQRMLQMRARGWVLRDLFPDVLLGCAITEEWRDVPVKGVQAASLNEIIEQEHEPPSAQIELFDERADEMKKMWKQFSVLCARRGAKWTDFALRRFKIDEVDRDSVSHEVLSEMLDWAVKHEPSTD